MNTVRKFLSVAAIVVAVVSISACSSSRSRIDADVLVVGGGTAGVPAAIQSARSGCKTVLVESGSQLGGTMTTGGVRFPGLFHAWGKQVIAGIGWDLVCRTVEMDGGSLPDFSKPFGTNHPEHQILINAPLYAVLAEEECINAGVQLRYYETPVKVHRTLKGWKVRLAGKGGASVCICCRQIIDATGNASVVRMTGLDCEKGEETQPGSLIFELTGYDCSTLDYEKLESLFEEARIDGRISRQDCYTSLSALLSHQGIAVSHVLGADSSSSETHTEANIEGRAGLLRLVKVLKTFPGLENLTIKYMASETAVRESWRIKGLYQMTAEDYVEGRLFEDAIAYSYYPIDLHDASGVEPRHLEEGKVPSVPLRSLIPQGGRNIVVAGRAVSSDRLANSALRVQATSMATGQAAGAVAALASRLGCQPTDVPIDDLKALLRENGAIVP